MWGEDEQHGQVDRYCWVIAAVGETKKKSRKEPIEDHLEMMIRVTVQVNLRLILNREVTKPLSKGRAHE